MNSSHPIIVAIALLVALVGGGCNRGKSGDAKGESASIDVWAATSEPSARIAMLLAPRDVPAEILVTRLPEEIEKISAKLTTAAELDPVTFLQIMRDGAQKGPPPYDSRLGITQEEYNLLTTGAHWELTKRADVVLKIAKTGDDRYEITGLPDMKELTFESSVQRVIMPYGELNRPAPFESTATQRMAGEIQGYVWRSASFGDALARFNVPEVVLGQSPNGDAWLKLTVIDTFDDRRIVDYFVRFAGPPK